MCVLLFGELICKFVFECYLNRDQINLPTPSYSRDNRLNVQFLAHTITSLAPRCRLIITKICSQLIGGGRCLVEKLAVLLDDTCMYFSKFVAQDCVTSLAPRCRFVITKICSQLICRGRCSCEKLAVLLDDICKRSLKVWIRIIQVVVSIFPRYWFKSIIRSFKRSFNNYISNTRGQCINMFIYFFIHIDHIHQYCMLITSVNKCIFLEVSPYSSNYRICIGSYSHTLVLISVCM